MSLTKLKSGHKTFHYKSPAAEVKVKSLKLFNQANEMKKTASVPSRSFLSEVMASVTLNLKQRQTLCCFPSQDSVSPRENQDRQVSLMGYDYM